MPSGAGRCPATVAVAGPGTVQQRHRRRLRLPSPCPTRLRSRPRRPFVPRTAAPGPDGRVRLAVVGDGADGSPESLAVTAQIAALDPDVFAYLGDVYDNGTPFEFDTWYDDPAGYGRFRGITNPAIGNHEYRTDGAAPVLRLLGRRAALLQLRRRRLAPRRARLHHRLRRRDRGGQPAGARVGAVRLAGPGPGRPPGQLHDRVHAPPPLQQRRRCQPGRPGPGLAAARRPERDDGPGRARAHVRALDSAGPERCRGTRRPHPVRGRHRWPGDHQPQGHRARVARRPCNRRPARCGSTSGRTTPPSATPPPTAPSPTPAPCRAGTRLPRRTRPRPRCPPAWRRGPCPRRPRTCPGPRPPTPWGSPATPCGAAASRSRPCRPPRRPTGTHALTAERRYAWTVEAFDAAGNRSSASAAATATTPFVRRSSRSLLAALRRAPERDRGFTASSFPGWRDADGDGCSTAAEVLVAEALRPPRVGTSCALTGGRWRSPYDGRYRTRSSRWSSTTSSRCARPGGRAHGPGDPRCAGSSPTTSATQRPWWRSRRRRPGRRSGREPQDWLPRPAYRCTYVADWVAVKWRWRLAVDPAERRFLTRTLRGCGWPQVRAAWPRRAVRRQRTGRTPTSSSRVSISAGSA